MRPETRYLVLATGYKWKKMPLKDGKDFFTFFVFFNLFEKIISVRTDVKYLNQADQIFRSLFSNVNKHPNISYENKENSDLKL